MNMGLAIGLAAWLMATVASVWAVRRWGLLFWDPVRIGTVAQEGGPYRAGLPLPVYRYGAPGLVRATATLAIAAFWAGLPAAVMSSTLGALWVLLMTFPAVGSIILLRSETRGVVAVLLAVWAGLSALFIHLAPSASTPYIGDWSPFIAVLASGVLVLLVATVALLQPVPRTGSSRSDDTPRDIRLLRLLCVAAWLVTIPLGSDSAFGGYAVLGFFLMLPIVIGALLLGPRPRRGVDAMFGSWAALAASSVVIAAFGVGPHAALGVAVTTALTTPVAFTVELKNYR